MKLFFITVAFFIVSVTAYTMEEEKEALKPLSSSFSHSSAELFAEKLSMRLFDPLVFSEQEVAKERKTLSLQTPSYPRQDLGLDSQLASLIEFTNKLLAPKQKPISYIKDKEGVRAVREENRAQGVIFRFSDRRNDMIILVNSCAYDKDKGTFWVEVTLIGPKGKGVRPILSASSYKEAKFLVSEREINNEFPDHVRKEILGQTLRNLKPHDLPRSDNPFLFLRHGVLAPLMPITDKSKIVTITVEGEASRSYLFDPEMLKALGFLQENSCKQSNMEEGEDKEKEEDSYVVVGKDEGLPTPLPGPIPPPTLIYSSISAVTGWASSLVSNRRWW